MDTRQYTLKIATSIHADDYDDTIEVSYPCAYTFDNGTHRLKYDDEENGFTVFKVLPNGEIEIRRRNSFTIIMREGYSHSVDCETPYGSIPMQFTLQSANHSLSEKGGQLEYIAHVYIDGVLQENRVTMELIHSERID